VDTIRAVLHTDELLAYRKLGKEFIEHAWMDHSADEYVRGDLSTNEAENFFSQLKRSIDGTHHRVSVQHLDRYLAEFDFRYSTRKLSDTERMQQMMGRVGRRLTNKPMTNKPLTDG